MRRAKSYSTCFVRITFRNRELRMLKLEDVKYIDVIMKDNKKKRAVR